MAAEVSVGVREISDRLGFAVLEEGAGTVRFSTSEICRPGLQFTGFYKKFPFMRVQIIGNAEMHYLYSLPEDELNGRIDRFMSFGVPCIVCARDNQPPKALLESAKKYGVPVFKTALVTDRAGHIIAEFIQRKLAPSILLHGELVDVSGVGVLIRGESGTGKSEAALDLVRSSHRLVADDVVQVSRVGETLIGRAPDLTQHIMEIRGVGIIDVRYLYGVGAVLPEKEINLIIDLEYLENYDRSKHGELGSEYDDILGVQLPKAVIPVSPGRNLAVVIEVAARSFRLRHLGYDDANEFRFVLNSSKDSRNNGGM